MPTWVRTPRAARIRQENALFLPTTPVEQQGYAYENVLSPGTAYNGLPLLLNAFLYDHNTWVQAESYAEYQLHSSLLYLLGMQAWLLIHDSGINWNFDNTTRHLFLRLNGLAMAYAMGATGASLDSAGMTDANFLVSDSETTLAAETNPTEGCSFTARTLVTTAQGKQAISKLHVGEKVLAYNPKTHQMELQPILHVWIDKDSDLVDLTLTTVKAQHGRSVSRQSEVIHTNKKHPFFTKERGFLPVGQIKLGMHVLRADGTHGVVTGWRVVPGTQVMYNLEVAQDHTFTVGSGEWVVHNDCGPSTLKNGLQVSLTEQGLEHSFDRHAAEWFGRNVTGADKPVWESLIRQAMNSSQIFDWDLRGRPTIAVLSRLPYYDEMRYFVVQFYRDSGELATAFRPNSDQLPAMFRLLGIGR